MRDTDEKPSKWRLVFHALFLAVFCVPLGWVQAIAVHYWRGTENLIQFAPLVLLLPLVFSPKIGKRYSFVPSLVFALVFTGMGFLHPVWLPEDSVQPLGGPTMASITVNGVDPRSFKLKGSDSIVSSSETDRLIAGESLVYDLEGYAKVCLLMTADKVVDIRAHIKNIDAKSVSEEKIRSFLQEVEEGKWSRLEFERQMSSLLGEQLSEPMIGRAFLAEFKGGSQVVIHHGKELLVFGNALYQNTRQVVSTTEPFIEPVDKHFKFASRQDQADYHYRYLEFQVKNIDDSHLYVELEPDEMVMKRAWAVFPLPMDFKYRGQNDVLEPYEGSP